MCALYKDEMGEILRSPNCLVLQHKIHKCFFFFSDSVSRGFLDI